MEKNINQNNFSELTDILLTKSEADHLKELVDNLSEALFSNKIKIEQKIDEIFPNHFKTILLKFIAKNNVNLEDTIGIQRFLRTLKEYLQDVVTVNLTLAFSPKIQTVRRVYTWFSFQLKQPLLLDITVDKTIIGGAIIDYSGVHFEYTIHKVLEQQLKNNQNLSK